jgi:hypothetical protein
LEVIQSFAQDKSNIKYGKISAQDFATKIYTIDSNAAAVVIADIGNSTVITNTSGWFSLEFKRFRRVHILNKNGYDAANISVFLYSRGDKVEKLDNLKAVTYNLENGKVVESRLDKSNVFKEKQSKNWEVRKFTFPNVKEGSIIEYEYSIISDFLYNIQPWEFQGEYPVLWSEYNFSKPEFLGYVFLSQGEQDFVLKDQKQRRQTYTMLDTRGAGASESGTINVDVTDYRWIKKNVPALKEESFTSSVNNYISKITFQFSDFRYPLQPQNFNTSWQQVCTDLLKSENFGAGINKNNGWLSDYVKPLLQGVSDDVEKAKKIYSYVQQNFTCTSHSGLELSQSLKNLVKTRNGRVSDINLLLTAMLNYAGIITDPVILSTRSHGVTHPDYPDLDKFNYVICVAHTKEKDFLLDASWPRLGFGKLTPDCYNGHSRIVNEQGARIDLSPDELVERKVTSILLKTDAQNNFMGSMQQMPGYNESHSIREQIKENGEEEFFKSVKKAYGETITELNNTKIEKLDQLDESISISYDFKLNQDNSSILYLNPMFGEGYRHNPFKSAERHYPVEMPYAMDETYTFSLIVPENYEVDEMPKPAVVKLNEEGDGVFEYRISKSGSTISLRSRIQFKRTMFMPEEYEVLREFFNLIVKKQNEQIVLKKKIG